MDYIKRGAAFSKHYPTLLIRELDSTDWRSGSTGFRCVVPYGRMLCRGAAFATNKSQGGVFLTSPLRMNRPSNHRRLDELGFRCAQDACVEQAMSNSLHPSANALLDENVGAAKITLKYLGQALEEGKYWVAADYAAILTCILINILRVSGKGGGDGARPRQKKHTRQ
jgi:hypothetical protein